MAYIVVDEEIHISCSNIDCDKRLGCRIYGRRQGPVKSEPAVTIEPFVFAHNSVNFEHYQVKCGNFVLGKKVKQTCPRCHLRLHPSAFNPESTICKSCEAKQ